MVRRSLLAAVALSFLFSAPHAASASIVTRGLTLPGSALELRFGLGIAHAPDDITGLGLDLGFAYGLSSTLELGVRTGFRFDGDAQILRADRFGRTFETETYGTGDDEIANPEVALRFLLARGAAQVALDTRLYIPVDDRIGVMIGLPIALRLGRARIDTGLYVPIIFRDETDVLVSLPLHLWIAAGGGVSVGPLTGIVFDDSDRRVPLGLGLAFALSGGSELRTWLLFPDVSEDDAAKVWGAGLGFALRF